jgi:hypothetical protein
MRCREPFSGCKLSSGHYLIHLVYFVGSFQMDFEINNEDYKNKEDAENLLLMLRCTHLMVPLFKMNSIFLTEGGFYSLDKIFDVILIFFC